MIISNALIKFNCTYRTLFKNKLLKGVLFCVVVERYQLRFNLKGEQRYGKFKAGVDMMIGGSLLDQAGMDTNLENLAEITMNVKSIAPKYPGSNVEKDNEAVAQAVAATYPYTKTILTSIKEKNPVALITHAKGCDVAGYDRSMFEEAIKLAKESDVVVLTIGGKYGWGGSCTIGEGIDTDNIGLTGVQEELALKLIETETPVVIVHMDGRPFSSVELSQKASAILENWFPGTTGGQALADVLFGDYNPAGRLSVTAPRSVGQIPIFNGQYVGNSYYGGEVSTSGGRYVDSTTEPLYYFGHGLSYTEFEYSNLSIQNDKVTADGTITVSCKVKNIGKQDGEEVVQIYVSDMISSMLRPYQEFAGCKRITLKLGEEKTVTFKMRADQFAFVGKDGKRIIEEGDMKVSIGGASNKLYLTGNFKSGAYIGELNSSSFSSAIRWFHLEHLSIPMHYFWVMMAIEYTSINKKRKTD